MASAGQPDGGPSRRVDGGSGSRRGNFSQGSGLRGQPPGGFCRQCCLCAAHCAWPRVAEGWGMEGATLRGLPAPVCLYLSEGDASGCEGVVVRDRPPLKV